MRTPNSKDKANQIALKALPANAAAAVQQLIRISQSLLTIAEKETQALLLNDMLAFAILQYEKEKIAEQYTKASEEFRNRLDEFRSTNPVLLNKLEKLQKELSEKATGNNTLVEHARQRAEAATQRSLKNIADMSSKKRIRFGKTILTSTAITEGA